MAVHTHWFNTEKTIIYVAIPSSVTVDELFAAQAKAFALMRGVRHHVDVIVDFSRLRLLPAGLISRMVDFAPNRHTHPLNCGQVVAIMPSLHGPLSRVGQIFSDVYAYTPFVTSLEEALNTLHTREAV